MQRAYSITCATTTEIVAGSLFDQLSDEEDHVAADELEAMARAVSRHAKSAKLSFYSPS